MKILDRLCAIGIALLGLGTSLLIPKAYPGRIWIFGTDLALLFAAMLNWLRIQNPSIRTVRMFCLTANAAMLALATALILSIGGARMNANPELFVVTLLALLETCFSLRGTR
jgi:hypothetical protein